MAFRVEFTSTVFSKPFAYSFWASMIMRTESEVEAVEGETPMRERKDFVADIMADLRAGNWKWFKSTWPRGSVLVDAYVDETED